MDQSLWEFFVSYQEKLITLTGEHIQLVGLAIIIAIIIGVPTGIYLTVNEKLAETVLQIASIMMTIPSLALFGIMMPLLSIINKGIGFVPGVIALILYSQLPIIRNTYVAIKNVDPQIRDSANGIGMTAWQRLIKIEIPNAMPLIMGGIRTAVVLCIGIGAIASFIGAGGLGVIINQGIARTNETMVIAGSIAVSILAIIADVLLALLQRWLTPKGLQS
ncbi:ABC transporter permease [Tuberibacillus sp. Marseille-P3662]|uniref:ABC transporter permease n=1 Tax=Tuberibacillus sp. Marseille-P3662 TaxID=1965358 RepID=UPI000A1C7B8A|nr:ABC transporter permease [Tuberibacillus sp. Marseille-P3662]